MKKVHPTASAASDAELTLYSNIRSLALVARNTVARAGYGKQLLQKLAEWAGQRRAAKPIDVHGFLKK